MLDAIQKSASSRLKSNLAATCAISYAFVDIFWFVGRSPFRLITAIFYIASPERQARFKSVVEDLSNACKCLLFVAATVAYLFASLFCPSRFNFYEPRPAPVSPPPSPKRPLPPPAPVVNPVAASFVARYNYPHAPERPLSSFVAVPSPAGRPLSSAPAPSSSASASSRSALVPFRAAQAASAPSLYFIADLMRGHFPLFPQSSSLTIPYQGGLLTIDLQNPEFQAQLPFLPLPLRQAITRHMQEQRVGSLLPNLSEIRSSDLEPLLQEIEGHLEKHLSGISRSDPPLLGDESWSQIEEEEVLEAAYHNAKNEKLSLAQTILRIFTRHEHIIKKMKYRHVLLQMRQKLSSSLDIPDLRTKIDRQPNSPLKTAADQLLTALLEPASFETEKKAYQAVVEALYNAHASLEESSAPAYHTLFDAAFRARYLCDLWPYMHELLNSVSGPLPFALTLNNLWDVIAMNNALCHRIDPSQGGISTADQKYQMLSGQLGIHFCPSHESNIPHRLFTLTFTDGHQIDFGRLSTPVSQTGQGAVARAALMGLENIWNSEKVGFFESALIRDLDRRSDADTHVTGDFKGFAQSLGKKNQTILHLIFEAKTKGHERSRWRARVGLESEHFHPLAAAFDGSFFDGSGAFEAIQTFNQLKSALLHHFEKEEGNFYLANGVKPRPEILENLFTEVHALFFQGRKKFTHPEEYQAYLILCYVYLVLYLAKTNRPSCINGGCKDFLDRGGVFAASFHLVLLLLLGEENNSKALNELRVNFLAPALIVKKKGVLEERAHLFKAVHQVIKDLSTAQKEEIRHGSFKGLLQKLEVHQVHDQHIFPSPNTAASLQEYQHALQDLRERHTLKSKSEALNLFPTKTAIMKQVTRDRAHLRVLPEQLSSPDADSLERFLKSQGFSETETLKIMGGCTQAAVALLFSELQSRFCNQALHVEIYPNGLHTENLKLILEIRKEEGVPVASIAVEQLYDLTKVSESGEKTPLAQVTGFLEIMDHRMGIAELSCKVSLPAS